jgi:dihydroflavonol-4-reductase
VVIAVTGAAGHVGTNLALALLRDGYPVRAVDLREPVTAGRRGAEWVCADIRDATAMRSAFEGADVVYHLAAVISIVGPLGGLVQSVNVDGVSAVAEAARTTRVRRLVHCSSVHAFDLAACRGATVDEASPRSVDPRLPTYDRSKAAGEARVAQALDRGLDAVIVNPTGIIGPLDEGPSRMGAVFRAIWRLRMTARVAGGFDWVDVRDVVAALRAAAQRGRTGENYLVPGHRYGFDDLARLAGTAAGGMTIRQVLPDNLVRAAAPPLTLLARRVPSAAALLPTSEALHAIDAFPVVSGAKAARELSHQPRPITDTLAELYAHFVATGRLRRR